MLLVISPAKKLDYKTPLPTKKHSKAQMLGDAQLLIAGLQKLSPPDIASMMSLSEALSTLNFQRYQEWSLPFKTSNARQAILAFKGDVYLGLDAYDYSTEDFAFAQDHLRILSGLYGILRPLDLMQAYRLEMGTSFSNERGRNLYEFWGSKISESLNKQLKKLGSSTLLNLASNEYFKSVETKSLNAQIVTPVFKDWKNDKYKVISFFAKKARGRMASYVIKNSLTAPEQILDFDWDGYSYSESMSLGAELVFTRRVE